MIVRVIFVLALVLVSSAHSAEFSGNVQLLQGENGLTTVSPEYNWSVGRFSGFGSHDRYKGGGTNYFAAHGIEFNVNGRFYLTAEFGFTSFGENQKYGAGVRLNSVPVFDKFFTYFNVTYFGHVTGEDSEQLKFAWGTKTWQFSEKVGVYAAGFTRRRSRLPNPWQPQVWLAFKDFPLEVGVEVDIYDGKSNPQLALKYSF